jgi:Tol biopolymer transport system component
MRFSWRSPVKSRWLMGALVAAALAVAFAAVTAGAKVSGTNGRIAFQQEDPASSGDTFVFTVNPDGSHAKRLVPSHTCCERFSPDGSKIVIAALTADGRITTATVNPDGSEYRIRPIPDPSLNLECDAWSPNGRHFACKGWDELHPKRRAGIFIARTTSHSGPPVRLTTNPYGGHDLPGDYSPDGKRFAFWRENPNRQGRTALFIVHVSGGPAKQITGWQGATSNTASWSPDGRWILTESDQGTIYVLHPDGTHRHPITLDVPSRAAAFDPGWSPDGKKIVLSLFVPTGPRSGNEAIYTANADGTNLISTGIEGDSADWGPSP